MNVDPVPLFLTIRLSFFATVLLLTVSIPLSYWLTFSRARFRVVVEVIVTLPLVLPPTVLGFYLLNIFRPDTGFGYFLDSIFGFRLAFSFYGLLIAALIFSLPFAVLPIRSGFQGLPLSLSEASRTLGKSGTVTLFRVLLPNMKPAILTSAVLSFAHTVGEFGVTLMVGGNIPGKTRTAAIAVYREMESLNYPAAHVYSLILLSISFAMLLLVYFFGSRDKIGAEF